MIHIVLIGAAYIANRLVSQSACDHDRVSTELLEALAELEIELWSGESTSPWYSRVVREVPGKLLTRTGELAPHTSLVKLLTDWEFDPTTMLTSGWGPMIAAQLERITVTSHMTAAMPTTSLQNLELRREVRIFFPVGDEATMTRTELCALVHENVAWEPLGLVDEAVPHRRWRADDRRTLSTCDVLLRLLALLASGRVCLAATEYIRSCDIFGVGQDLQVDPGFPVYRDWKIERNGQDYPLAEVLLELFDASACEAEVVGPGRRWISTVIEDRPFLWAELVEKIEEIVATRGADEVVWLSRLRRSLSHR